MTSTTPENTGVSSNESYKNSEILLKSLILKIKTDEEIVEMKKKITQESQDDLVTKQLLEMIENRIQNILYQQDESYPELSSTSIPNLKEGMMSALLVDKSTITGDLYFIKTVGNNDLPVYKLDNNQELNNNWFINRFGIDNKQYMIDTTALVLDIDSSNTINMSNTNDIEKQNVLKDLFDFDSATNIPLYSSMGALTSQHNEIFNMTTGKWENLSHIVNDLYNNARFVYQSDKVEYRTVKNADLPNNNAEGNLIENTIYYLHKKDTDAEAVINDWKQLEGYDVEDYYGDNSYSFSRQRKTKDLNNVNIYLKPGQIFFVSGQPYGRLDSNRINDTLMRFEIVPPKLQYTITTRKFQSQEDGYERDAQGIINTYTETKEIPDVHTCEYTNKFSYFIDDCYTNIVSTSKLDKGEQHNHVVNTDQLSIGYSTNIDPVTQDNTIGINDSFPQLELKQIRFKDLFKKKYPDAIDVKKVSVHGSLGFRMLYRLNSRMPMYDSNDGKVKGLKSVNRMNVIEDELVVSMWQNIRTVPGVSEKS